MSLTVARWVFQSHQERSLEENERWWRECYLPSPTDAALQSQPRWQVIVGNAGSGKTVALDALERQMRGHDALVLRYSPEYWPRGRRVLKKDGNHLSQLMALTGFTIRHTPTITLDRIIELPRFQREFLRWLMDKFGGTRAYIRWIQTLGGNADDAQLNVPFEDLYPTETEYLDVQGQIEDLIALVRRWGFSQILTLIDTDLITTAQLTELGELFDWLELWQHEGFTLVVAVTPTALDQGELVKRARGRASVVRLNWTLDQVRNLVNRHLALATDQQVQSLEQLASPLLVHSLEEKLLAEYGSPTPKGWLALAQLLLDFALRSEIPLGDKFETEIHYAFMARFMPLRLDKRSGHRGVWRGSHFIHLDDQPFRLVEMLAQHQGMPTPSEELKDVAGSLSNVHTLVRRVREAIEPNPSAPIYLKNRRDEGYWLENLAPDPIV